MVYGNRISISKDDLEFSNIDLGNYTKSKISMGMGEEIANKMMKDVEEIDNPMTGGKDYELRLVAYPMREFSSRIKELKLRISHLSSSTQTDIINVFIGEDDNRYKKDDGKVYI